MKSAIKGIIVHETEKYIYTVETVSYTERKYFVDFKVNGYTSFGCRAYETEEDARKGAEEEKEQYNFKNDSIVIRMETFDTKKAIKHRYSK